MSEEGKEEEQTQRILEEGKKFIPLVECQDHIRKQILLFERLIAKHVTNKSEAKKMLQELHEESRKVASEVSEFFLQDIIREFTKIEVEQSRVNHLSRIIVQQFANKFPPVSDEALNEKVNNGYVEGYIPRKVVPFFLEAFKGIFGSDYIEEKQTKCNEYVKRYFQPWCMRIDWKGVFRDPDVVKMVKEILFELRKVLEENENYRTWFKREIGKSDIFLGHDNEDLNEKQFKLLTSCLFRAIT